MYVLFISICHLLSAVNTLYFFYFYFFATTIIFTTLKSMYFHRFKWPRFFIRLKSNKTIVTIKVTLFKELSRVQLVPMRCLPKTFSMSSYSGSEPGLGESISRSAKGVSTFSMETATTFVTSSFSLSIFTSAHHSYRYAVQ